MNIAICVIAYNRLDSLKRCISFLEKADYPEPVKLYISVDKSNTTIVEDYAKAYHWEHGEYEAILHEKNLGLRTHILGCGDLLQKHDALIVLEDDIVVSPNFMHYSIQSVEKYYDDTNIAGISLYHRVMDTNTYIPFTPIKSEYDVFFLQYAESWGQIWMSKQWIEFKTWYKDHDEDFKLDYVPANINRWTRSWLKYHIRYCIDRNKYFVCPYESLTTNYCESGTHVKKTKPYYVSNFSLFSTLRYNLPDFSKCSVRYDAFFQPEFLYTYLNIEKESLTVDLWGKKSKRLCKRYLLSIKSFPFKIIKSYDLTFQPWELNIILDMKGAVIHLYDTFIPDKEPDTCDMMYLHEYIYSNGYDKAILHTPYKTLVKDFLHRTLIQLKKLFK